MRFRFLLTLLLTATFAGALLASPLTYTGGGLGGAVTVNANGHDATVFAGQLNINLNGASMIAFCVDFFAPLARQTYDNTTGPVSSYAGAGRAAWILQTYGPNLVNNEQAAALQLALWEIIHDQGNGLGTGSFTLVANAMSTLRLAADAIVQASAGRSSNNATVLYNTFPGSGTRAQTLITATADPGTGVPEPSTYAMLALGGSLIALAAVRRRKR